MPLSPEEAIGITDRKDYPILDGKEVMLQADYKGAIGQAFTSAPAAFQGSLDEILRADPVHDDHARALFIAALNAVMRYLGLADGTIHCKDDGPERCAEQFIPFLKEKFDGCRILQVGFQPALFAQVAKHFEMRLLDLNPKNIGKTVHGVEIEDGAESDEAKNWADVILCTGSTLANGSIVEYMDLDCPVFFYGTTLAGAAPLLGLNRACFCSE